MNLKTTLALYRPYSPEISSIIIPFVRGWTSRTHNQVLLTSNPVNKLILLMLPKNSAKKNSG